jgi:DNA-binding NarL/FixJ family response regulator
MLVRVAVSDPLPLFCRGVIAALADAGFDAEAPDDLLAWVRTDERRIVLFTVRTDDDWTLLAEVCAVRSATVVIALVDDSSVAAHVRALLAGAVGVLSRDAPPEKLRAAFEAAIDDHSVLPIAVVRAFAAQAGSAAADASAGSPTAKEIEWLRELAHGGSVAKLADRIGYSERMMFRLLRELYVRMGVANRTEALMRARDEGWL